MENAQVGSAPWQDTARLNALLRPWLAQRVAQQGAVLGLSDWQRADGGFSNITLTGELLHDGAPARALVLRLQATEAAVFPDTDLARQYRVMCALQGSTVAVPPLLGYEGDASLLGSPFYLMERVAGRVPNENPQYHVSGWFHDLPAAHQAACWMAGIDALGAISRVDWRACGLDFLAPRAGCTPLQAQLDYYRSALAWAESLGRPYPHLHAGLAWLDAHQPADEPTALVWGDAKLGNCVFDGTRLAAVLDWEQAALANPVDDLAWWLMVDESLSAGYGAPRLTGLPTREASIARWETAAGRKARDLDYYEVFAAWRMAYVLARLGTLFTARGWVRAEVEMDVNNGGATLLARHAQRLGFASRDSDTGALP